MKFVLVKKGTGHKYIARIDLESIPPPGTRINIYDPHKAEVVAFRVLYVDLNCFGNLVPSEDEHFIWVE
jgi:hypothetical protein